jgi:predicted nucleic acid-binding protein
MSGIVPDLLVDTDIFVDHLRGTRRLQPGRDRILYSVVTRCELFAGREVEEETVQRLLEPFEEIPVDRPVAERAGRLRRTGLRTPDALIAATALDRQLVLVTRNTRDFQSARGLKLRHPG